ncbi:ATP-binding protein [Pseudomonas stutzeri]|uniref:ATP-binding protein n=1 Tax=Stutzerimonas stutzeri TaxID=316 RepID=UPI00210948F7|nr:ATP-binding protein [Stutzerimonas stutzeri]MCQ4310678.1 ATP-binding protein [Stutzerimonas stutzeri]
MPSLNRIILINTHLQGVVELVVDGHTNICGTNASGKTTLQRLVPVFYGEYPSRVVPATRDSFERWYLPTEQSFIIYEYRRMDDHLCQVVLASASDGKGVVYRLVQKGFDLEDYTKSRQGEAITCLSMAELGRQLKQAGVPITTLLNTRQFRAIIQNDRSLLAADGQRAELRTWARQFSLCDSEHSLRHIEKLARAVHSREGKMETVKSMVAAILEEDGVSPPSTHLNLQRVEDWIRDSRLIQGFNAIRPEFDKLEREYQDLLASEHRLSGLLLGYRADDSRLFQRQEETASVIEQTGRQLKQLEEQWKDQRDTLNQEFSAAKGDVSRIEEELDQIEEQYQVFLDADMDQAKADLEQVGVWRDDLNNLQARHRLLTEQHRDVEHAYLERQQAIKDQREAALDQLREQQDALREERDSQKALQDDALNTLEQTFNSRRQQGVEAFGERKHQLHLEQNRLQQLIDNSGYTEDENLSLAILDRRLDEADEKVEAAESLVQQLQNQERLLRNRRDESNNTLTLCRRRLNERQEQLDDLERLLYPGQHTLLEFLRREQPGWESRLGKVIEPALLQRADLKPALSETDPDSLFGLHLDLSTLDVPAHAASEAELRRQVQLAKDALEDAQNQQQEAEKQLIEATAALDEQQHQLVVARTDSHNRRDDRQRLKEERRNQKEKLDAALAERRIKARKQLAELEAQLKQLASEHQDWLDELKNQHHEERLEKSAHWQQVIGSLDSQIRQLKANADERREKAKNELDECELWYQAELTSRGVDEAAIIDLKRQIKTLGERITRAEQRRSDVLRYEEWYRHSWLQRKPKLQSELSQGRTCMGELEQQLKTATASYKSERSRFEDERLKAIQLKGSLDDALTRLKSLLKRLGELKLPRDGEIAEGELDERLRLGEEQLHAREQMLSAIKSHVEHFDNLIVGQSGSNLAETWERSREECTLVNVRGISSLDYRKLVPHLAQLLNVLVPQSLTALREQGKIFGIDLHGYYEVLADIDRRIATQSARITREVSEELFLDGVSDSAVRIRSRISELEFWPELKAFISAFREWREDGFSELPSEEYTASMRRALDIIGRSAVSNGIAGLLEIELRLREGNSDLVIRTDRQLNESSSHGMAYLILCKFLLAFTRLLRGGSPATIHWPIDELGTLHHNNVKKIFDACSNNNIRVLGAFPNPDSEVLSLFTNRYIVNKQTRQLQVVKPKVDLIAAKLMARRTGEVV